MARIWMTVVVVALLVLAGCAGGTGGGGASAGDSAVSGDGASGGASVGVAAGGAQDANTFRRNVKNGYVPQPTDITYEGLYHDYYFDTGETDCRQRFCPTYSRAVSNDPLSGETEQFVAVGLTSGLSQSAFTREKVNLIVVVDSSGSMSEQFDQYYYDGEKKREVTENQAKMRAAREAVRAMTDKLGPGDRLGVVEYDDDATTVRGLSAVESNERVRSQLGDVQAGGGTNLAAGMDAAERMAADAPTGENRTTRVVYVTDAMPNQGEVGTDRLESRLSRQAESGVYSTFVGVGVDFNSKLTESLGTVRGANYYTVHSPEQFRTRMAEGFGYMVTPLAYDLTVSAETTGYEVENVYGTPNQSPERLVHVKTLFPSRSSEGGGEGSVILLELDRTEAVTDRQVTLTASYETPDGEQHTTAETVEFAGVEANHYDSSGVRKAVVLTEYASVMRNWAAHERAIASDRPTPEMEDGVEHRELGRWEQRSVPLRVSSRYHDRFVTFARYFERHQRALGAERMADDARLVRRLANRTAAAEE